LTLRSLLKTRVRSETKSTRTLEIGLKFPSNSPLKYMNKWLARAGRSEIGSKVPEAPGRKRKRRRGRRRRRNGVNGTCRA